MRQFESVVHIKSFLRFLGDVASICVPGKPSSIRVYFNVLRVS